MRQSIRRGHRRRRRASPWSWLPVPLAASAALAFGAFATVPAAAATPASQLAAITTQALRVGPGSQGPAVVILQDTLNDLGQRTAVDGTYGARTSTAVATLANGLGLSSEPLPTELALLGYGPRAVLLSLGDKGPAVAALQRALTRAGYGVEATGTFGPQTEAEVEAFQQDNGLEVDGQISLWGVEEVAALEGEATGAIDAIVNEETTLAAPPAVTPVGQKVADFAASLNGRYYAWGGVGPWAFDCSGLVVYAMGQVAGISVPHSSYAQWDMGTAVAPGYLQPGDLVFFDTDGAGPSHVGIYLGGASEDFVDATNPGGGVQIDSLYNAYWGRHYIGARDILG